MHLIKISALAGLAAASAIAGRDDVCARAVSGQDDVCKRAIAEREAAPPVITAAPALEARHGSWPAQKRAHKGKRDGEGFPASIPANPIAASYASLHASIAESHAAEWSDAASAVGASGYHSQWAGAGAGGEWQPAPTYAPGYAPEAPAPAYSAPEGHASAAAPVYQAPEGHESAAAPAYPAPEPTHVEPKYDGEPAYHGGAAYGTGNFGGAAKPTSPLVQVNGAAGSAASVLGAGMAMLFAAIGGL
ncbi:hypothetical protein B0T22DRAFT_477341 [Podospora appendiculata]|uniref:Uncharacterized protein n=1 Tax=Podospora appendiculata TaxID=314037 RepID=A0AAE1CHS6_9PEZI|nr:hypothetical protein B0T22DRAFT_477341 [Podospora appendiculata]